MKKMKRGLMGRGAWALIAGMVGVGAGFVVEFDARAAHWHGNVGYCGASDLIPGSPIPYLPDQVDQKADCQALASTCGSFGIWTCHVACTFPVSGCCGGTCVLPME